MILAEQFADELQSRLNQFFSEQAQGYDIPPAVLFRLEGFIEAGLSLGLCSESVLKEQLVELASRHIGEQLAELYRHDSRLILHGWMPEAPVYPSGASEPD